MVENNSNSSTFNLETSNEKVIEDRIEELIEEYGLTTFGKNMMKLWIDKSAIDQKGHLKRLRQWILMKINKQIYPKTISKWQYGCPDLVPGLRSIPIWNSENFEWIQQLEQMYPIIKEELLNLQNQKGFQQYRAPSWASSQQAMDGKGSISHEGGDWNVFYLFLHNMNFHINREKCPQTVQFIESISSHYHHAFFSALAPQTHIVKHHGPTNRKLRCHLPLIVPKGKCELRVGNELITMKEGKCFLFDDSFEHEAWNNDLLQSRIVLIIDIWHPDFSLPEQKFFKFLQTASLRLDKQQSSNQVDTFYHIIQQAHEVGISDKKSVWT